MSSPQDPNQPGQPGQGWGQPAQSAPGWGAPTQPPSQPGWGAPPPNQPGWGGQGLGYQQPPGWGAPPARSNRHGCLIAFLIVLLGLVLVAGCTIVVAGPYITTTIKLYQDVGTDRMSGISFETINGQTTWIIRLKPGLQGEAKDMACKVVWPDLNGTAFEIVAASGEVLATDTTPCT